jgi:LysR family glycine cleavage system transcriptional activator
LSDFQRSNPRITINITTRQSPVDFTTEPFDAAIFNDPSLWPGTVSQHLMDADLVAVCSPKLHAKRAIKEAADVARFPLLHKIGKPNRWGEWMAKAGVAFDEPMRGHTYQNFAMLAQAAASGLGVALLPRYLVDQELSEKRLEIVAKRLVEMSTSYHLIVPEVRASSSAVPTFAKWLIAEAQRWNETSVNPKIGRVGKHPVQSAAVSRGSAL